MDRDEQKAELPDAEQEAVDRCFPGRRLRRRYEKDERERGENEPERRQHQRRGLADADLDCDEGEAPDDRDADRGENVARAHAASPARRMSFEHDAIACMACLIDAPPLKASPEK